MSTEQGAMSGAATGAQIGTSIMPGIGTAIGAVGGAILGGIGGKKAAKAKRKAYKRASAILGQLRQTAEQSRDLSDPFNRHRGGIAQNLADMVTGRKSFQTDPGYNFMYDEAMRGATRQMRAGGVRGGSVLAALQDRGVGLANQQYSTVIDRLTNLAGATPQNAIAGGQIYGGLEQARIEGQAQLALGGGYAKSQEAGAKWGGLAETATSLGKAWDTWQGMRGGTPSGGGSVDTPIYNEVIAPTGPGGFMSGAADAANGSWKPQITLGE